MIIVDPPASGRARPSKGAEKPLYRVASREYPLQFRVLWAVSRCLPHRQAGSGCWQFASGPTREPRRLLFGPAGQGVSARRWPKRIEVRRTYFHLKRLYLMPRSAGYSAGRRASMALACLHQIDTGFMGGSYPPSVSACRPDGIAIQPIPVHLPTLPYHPAPHW